MLKMNAWDFPPIVAAGILLMAYGVFRGKLPQHIPVHWGSHGPDRFVSPERGLVESAILAFVVWLFLALISNLDGKASDKASTSMRTFMMPLRGLVPACLLLFMGCILAKPLLGEAAFGVGLGIFILGNLTAIVVGLIRLPEGALSADPEDLSQHHPECWKWGVFYINPGDARLWVPKRGGGGWTFNFAHQRAKVYTACMLLFPLAILMVAMILG